MMQRPRFPSQLNANKSIPCDISWISSVLIEQATIQRVVANITSVKLFDGLARKNERIAALVHAIGLLDLTTLAGDDTPAKVAALCSEAVHPLPLNLVGKLETSGYKSKHVSTGAVCVYPARVRDVAENLRRLKAPASMRIASVATGFPTGLYPLESRLLEIQHAIDAGATEIDIVIDRTLVLTGQWQKLYDEIAAMKKACEGRARLKTILGVGELDTLTNVYRASVIAMQAGSDFIKTSTGKETVNATLPVGLVMLLAIRDYYERTGATVGLKPAGGIKSSSQALEWMTLVQAIMGDLYLSPELFRIGASSLLGSIVNDLQATLSS